MADKNSIPALDLGMLQGSVTRIEYLGRIEDLRAEIRGLSETVFDTRKLCEELFIKVEKLEKENAILKKKLKE